MGGDYRPLIIQPIGEYMNDKDKAILKKLFVLLDYCRKIHKSSDEDFVFEMYSKVSLLKSRLSFRYRNRDEKALRYLVS
jgi:hypothetical protein